MNTVVDEKVKSTDLLLKRGQIHVGMTVAMVLKGKNLPELDEKGKPLLFKILAGGVPIRVKFYPIEEGKISSGYDNVKPEMQFMPIHVFSPEEAPVDTDFVVLINGERQNYESSINTVYLFKDRDGSILSVNSYEDKFLYKKFPLPANAQLVPLSEIGEARKIYEKYLPRHHH